MSEELIGRFKDKTGCEWIIDLDVATCREVLKLTGIDLANFHDGKSLQALWSNDEKLVDVLWVLVKEQAEKLREEMLDQLSMVFVLLLSTFIGLGVIARVSRLLHTPLMSITNAISAIAIVGSILIAML